MPFISCNPAWAPNLLAKPVFPNAVETSCNFSNRLSSNAFLAFVKARFNSDCILYVLLIWPITLVHCCLASLNDVSIASATGFPLPIIFASFSS